MWQTSRVLLPLLILSAISLSAPSPPATRHVMKVTGDAHKLVLFSDGTVVGWGLAENGQLGPVDGIPINRSRETKAMVSITLPGKAIDVAAGIATSYALLDDGSVWAWGRGDQGQLGVGTAGVNLRLANGNPGTTTPMRVQELGDVRQIGARGNAAFAVMKDGTVRAWGDRANGMIGDGLHIQHPLALPPPAFTPVTVPNVANVTQLSVGSSHVLALTADGRVLAWGSNHFGALGRAPRQEQPLDVAAEVTGLTGVVAVASGLGVSTALKKDGTVWVWGANWYGQFGFGERTDPPGVNYGYQLVPQKVPGIANVTAISLGIAGRQTLALLKDGTLRGWGNSDWGQIGAGVKGDFQEHPVVPKISGVKAVWACGNNSYALRSDDTFWTWGAGAANAWPLKENVAIPMKLELQ